MERCVVNDGNHFTCRAGREKSSVLMMGRSSARNLMVSLYFCAVSNVFRTNASFHSVRKWSSRRKSCHHGITTLRTSTKNDNCIFESTPPHTKERAYQCLFKILLKSTSGMNGSPQMTKPDASQSTLIEGTTHLAGDKREWKTTVPFAKQSLLRQECVWCSFVLK